MFLLRCFRKRCIIHIILSSIPFVIFLIGINRQSSNPMDRTVLTRYFHISPTNITRTLDNISYIQFQPSSTSANAFRHKCDILVMNKVSLAHRFPHIIIIGFGKAGTRALYQMIRMHPDVVGPSNEVRFFSNDFKYRLGVHSYIRLMPQTTSTVRTVEKSPDYIIRPVAAERLKKALQHCHRSSEIKFIVVLREPFRRAVSEYLHWKLTLQHMGKTLKDFEEIALKKSGEVNNYLAQVNTSIYSYHLQNWLKVFDMKKMCFVNGDNLVKDPYTVLKKLEKCLELRDFLKPNHFYFDENKGYYCPVDIGGNPKCLGSAKGRTHPKVDEGVELKLRNFFQPYNKELYEITGINFEWT